MKHYLVIQLVLVFALYCPIGNAQNYKTTCQHNPYTNEVVCDSTHQYDLFDPNRMIAETLSSAAKNANDGVIKLPGLSDQSQFNGGFAPPDDHLRQARQWDQLQLQRQQIELNNLQLQKQRQQALAVHQYQNSLVASYNQTKDTNYLVMAIEAGRTDLYQWFAKAGYVCTRDQRGKLGCVKQR